MSNGKLDEWNNETSIHLLSQRENMFAEKVLSVATVRTKMITNRKHILLCCNPNFLITIFLLYR